MYNINYGIDTTEIKRKLAEGNQGIIISDINTIKKVISVFGDSLKVICILLKNRRIEDFVDIMFMRDNIECDIEIKSNIISISKKLTSAYTENDKKAIEILNVKFEKLIRKCYIKDIFAEFVSFWERYESIVNSHEIFEKNQDIFKYSIFNDNVDDAYHECVDIIKRSEV